MSPRRNPILLRGPSDAERYGGLVAAAYLAAVPYDPAQRWRWDLLARHVETMFLRIQRGKNGVRVLFVPGQPYESAEQLKRGVAATNTLLVSSDYNEHPVFSPQTNLKFRAIHDYLVHIGKDVDFSLRGEIAAYNAHAKIAPRDAIPALFTEIVGQASVKIVNGFFPEQKIVLLPFDFYRVGVEVSGPRRGVSRQRRP